MVMVKVGIRIGVGVVEKAFRTTDLRVSIFSSLQANAHAPLSKQSCIRSQMKISVLANWIKPDLKCDRPPQDLTTTVSPPGYNPPMRLNRGSHKITYTYTYKNGDKIDSRKCFVNLDIGGE